MQQFQDLLRMSRGFYRFHCNRSRRTGGRGERKNSYVAIVEVAIAVVGL